MVQASTPEQHAAYRAGLCVDCKNVPYSAGRTVCADCHTTRINPNSSKEKQQ